MKLFKSKTSVLLLGLLAAGGALWALWGRAPDHVGPTAIEGKKTPSVKAHGGASGLPPVRDMIGEPKKEGAPVVSNASIPQDTMTSLRETLEGLAKFRDHERNKDDRKNV